MNLIMRFISVILIFICLSAKSQEIFTLEKCKALALQNNVKAQNSQLAIEAAEQVRKEAFTKYFPSVNAIGMGVVPMIISKDLMWSPVGTVICFGTLISMIFVVTVLPVAYWLIFRRADKKVSI